MDGPVQPGFAVRRCQHPVALCGQHVLQCRAHGQLVFDDQEAFHFLTTDGHGWTQMKTTNAKLQAPEKLETPSTKPFRLCRRGSSLSMNRRTPAAFSLSPSEGERG